MPYDFLDTQLGTIARELPGATRILHAQRLDFCCNGQRTLAEACLRKGIDPAATVAALEQLCAVDQNEQNWNHASAEQLIPHILTRYHECHREQLPELIRLARRVEQVHGNNPDCPNGLTDHLCDMQQELESHMAKEEQILFPMLMRGEASLSRGPISVMRFEHDQHSQALDKLYSLTNDVTPPPHACNTWQALYRGLNEFCADLMDHIHLENNILFVAQVTAKAL